MTIFDVLRYPISIRPTEEEIDNLPSEIYNDWARCWKWRYKGLNSKQFYAQMRRAHWEGNDDFVEEFRIDTLRQIILEYDPEDESS